MASVSSKLQAGAAADYSWLPELVEIGGFRYESGCREFGPWAASMEGLLGAFHEPLFREIWESIPRCAAERFGELFNGTTEATERFRLARAYRNLNLQPGGAGSSAGFASSLLEIGELLSASDPETETAAKPTSQDAAEAGDDSVSIHRHTCAGCGNTYLHEAWQCEPPDDRYCNLCSEEVGGSIPVWIERLSDASGSGEDPADRSGMLPKTRTPALCSRQFGPTEGSAGDPGPAGRRCASPESVATSVSVCCAKESEAPAAPIPTALSQGAEEMLASKTNREAEAKVSAKNVDSDPLSRFPTPSERGFAKVAGMHELKKLLYEEVVSALRDPDDLKAYGLTIPNGILLFGPPGCGKTYISRQLAEEMNYFFKEVFPSEIGSTFIHETTLKIREVFDFAYQQAPAIIFVDEFESMVPARKNLGAHQQHTAEEVSEFLKQLEACAERKILLIAATNEPWKIDPAVQRTGRLDKKIYVGAPDKSARAEMLRFHLYGRRMCEIDVTALADSLDGYSASDLKLVVDEAARLARKAHEPISEHYLRQAAGERVPPSVTPEDEQKYLSFGQRGVRRSPISYVAANTTLPGRRQVDLVRKWGRGRPPGHDSFRSNP